MRFRQESTAKNIAQKIGLPFSLWDSRIETHGGMVEVEVLPFSLWDSSWFQQTEQVKGERVAVLLMRFFTSKTITRNQRTVAVLLMRFITVIDKKGRWKKCCRSPYEILTNVSSVSNSTPFSCRSPYEILYCLDFKDERWVSVAVLLMRFIALVCHSTTT